jgi:hypothetical protein
MALEACEFFEIKEADARRMIRETAEHIAGNWPGALTAVGVSGALTTRAPQSRRDRNYADVGGRLECQLIGRLDLLRKNGEFS